MEKEIKTSMAYRGQFDVFWIPEQLRSNKPFTIDHAIPAFLVLGLGLTPATIVFLLELMQHFCRKKTTDMAFGSTSMIITKVDKDDLRYGKGYIEDAESEPYLK